MIVRLIIWAMATGFVTGAVWFAIHFLRRGGSVPLALRGEGNHDALTPGAVDRVNGYLPLASTNDDSRNIRTNVEAPSQEN